MTLSPRTQILDYLNGPKPEDRSALEDTPAGQLTPEQLIALAWSKRAVENAEPLPPLEYETRELTVQERLYRSAQDFRSWGAPEREIGVDLAWKLIKLGYSTEDAEELLRDVGVEWSASRTSAA
jgi:hypothetical protein